MDERGILHKIMLFVILGAGFALALVLPQLKKQADVKHARQAAKTAIELAAAEKDFYAKNGFYTADFSQLGLALPCSVTAREGRTVLHCAHYDFELADAMTLQASSTKYPKWFTVSLEDGKVTCGHEDGSLVGARICSKVDLP